jgi:hypothetical protein
VGGLIRAWPTRVSQPKCRVTVAVYFVNVRGEKGKVAGAKLANQNQNLQTAFPQFHSVQVFRTRRQTHLSTLLLTWEAW